MNAPFRYTAGDRAKIRKLLPLITTPRTQTWSSLPLRLPTIVPSSTVQVQTVERALMTLEQFANMFLIYEREFRLPLYHHKDLEATLNRAHMLASETLLSADRHRDDVDRLAELARVAKAHLDTRYRQRSRRTKWAQDWYIEKLLFVWESCGGATHTSVKEGRGGPPIQFIQCASGPVLRAGAYKPLSALAVREIVRKLLAERKPSRPRD